MSEIRTRAARVTGFFKKNFTTDIRTRDVFATGTLSSCTTVPPRLTHISFTNIHMLGETQFEEKSGRNRSATTTELKTEDPRLSY
jgi:hypothetical protein